MDPMLELQIQSRMQGLSSSLLRANVYLLPCLQATQYEYHFVFISHER